MKWFSSPKNPNMKDEIVVIGTVCYHTVFPNFHSYFHTLCNNRYEAIWAILGFPFNSSDGTIAFCRKDLKKFVFSATFQKGFLHKNYLWVLKMVDNGGVT